MDSSRVNRSILIGINWFTPVVSVPIVELIEIGLIAGFYWDVVNQV